MDIEVTRRSGVCVLALAGRLIRHDGDEALRARFGDAVERGDRRFVLDLTRLEQIDSAGIGELVACVKRAEAANAVIRLAVRDECAVGRVLRLTQVDRAFEVHPDADAAVAAFP